MITMNPQAWAAFGHGDILVGSMLCYDGEGTGVGVLTLRNGEPHEIGDRVPHPEGEDPFNAPIVLSFKNVQSLDVVIEHLNHIRNDMSKWENGELTFEETPDGI